MKRGDLVLALNYTHAYDTKLRLSEMRKGDLCIVLSADETHLEVFGGGRQWSLPKEYFKLVEQ